MTTIRQQLREHIDLTIVGEAPSPLADHLEPGRVEPLFPVPETSTGGKLLFMLGVPTATYMAIDRRNLFDVRPIKPAWPVREARERAADILEEMKGRRVLLLGKRVAQAFGYSNLMCLRWIERDEIWMCDNGSSFRKPFCQIAVCPHPSGLNPWWNDVLNVREAERFLLKLGDSLPRPRKMEALSE